MNSKFFGLFLMSAICVAHPSSADEPVGAAGTAASVPLLGVYSSPIALLFPRDGRMVMETRNGHLQTFLPAENRWRSLYYLGNDLTASNSSIYFGNRPLILEPEHFVGASRDGKTLFGASYQRQRSDQTRVYVWDAATRRVRFVIATKTGQGGGGYNGSALQVVDVSGDGKTLVFQRSGRLQIVDLESKWAADDTDSTKRTRFYSAQELPTEGEVLALAFAPDSRTLAIYGTNGLSLFDAKTRQPLTRAQSLKDALPLSLDTTRPPVVEAGQAQPFGDTHGLGGGFGGNFRISPNGEAPVAMKWSSDGKFLAVMRGQALWLLSADGQLQARTETAIMPAENAAPIRNPGDVPDASISLPLSFSLSWSPDNCRIAVGGASVEVRSVPALELLQTLSATAPAAFLPDGSLVTPKPDDAPQYRLLKWKLVNAKTG